MSESLSLRYERSLIAALLVFLVLLPLPLGANRVWAMATIAMFSGAIGLAWGVGIWLGKIRPSKALKPGLPMFIVLLAVQLWVAMQWVFGISADPAATALSLILGLSYSLLFLLIISLFATRQRLLLLLTALVVGGTLQAFYGTFMALSGFEWTLLGETHRSSGVASGTFVNRNHFAGYIELTLACGIGLMMALRSTASWSWSSAIELVMGPKARLRLALVILVIALVMTRSRGGNLAFFSAMLVMSLIFIVRNKENRRRNIFILLSLILIDTLVISQYFGLENLKDRLVNTRLVDSVKVIEVEQASIDTSTLSSANTAAQGVGKAVERVPVEIVQQANEIRSQVIMDGLPLAMQKPMVGQGAGTFEVTYPQYADESVRLHFDHAHNDFLQFFIEYGAIGSLLLALFVGWALYYAMAALWQTKSLFRNGLGLGISIGIVSLMIHSFSDFNLQIPANAITFITLCAIAVLTQNHSKRTQKL